MKNKILVYDDLCPFCNWYSGLFVRTGLLPRDGRKAFSSLDTELLRMIDINRGRNEIPLIDTSSGTVKYGIDALLEILGTKMPVIKKVGNMTPVNWVLRKIYKLISYNRKLIIGTRCGPGAIDCSPDINYRYRLLFLVLCLLFNTIMLFPIHYSILNELSWYDLSIVELQAVHFGLVFINCSLMLAFRKEKAFEYIGQVNMLALIAILLHVPLLLLSFVGMNEWLNAVYLLIVAVIIFREYLRRMEYAGILQRYKWISAINLTTLVGFILFVFN
jgi:hypothetical protein